MIDLLVSFIFYAFVLGTGALAAPAISRLRKRRQAAQLPAARFCLRSHVSGGPAPGARTTVETLADGSEAFATQHWCKRCGAVFVALEALDRRDTLERRLEMRDAADEIRATQVEVRRRGIQAVAGGEG